MHPSSLAIQDGILYVDAFSDTWMQFNGECAINMDLLYVVRTSSSYSQLFRVVHFLQNFLTRSIVILTSLPVGAAKVVIDILFTASCDDVPVRYQWDIARAPGMLPNVAAVVTHMACIAVTKV
jgi:hypothetical protein